MTDIVKRLRQERPQFYESLMKEAADEIEMLREAWNTLEALERDQAAEIERLQAQWGDSDPEKMYQENKCLRAEIGRLRAHAESMIGRLNADIDAKAAEIERLGQIVDGAGIVKLADQTEIDHLREEVHELQGAMNPVAALGEMLAAENAQLRARIAELEDPHYLKGLQAEIERLRDMIDNRNEFIAERGLWGELGQYLSEGTYDPTWPNAVHTGNK